MFQATHTLRHFSALYDWLKMFDKHLQPIAKGPEMVKHLQPIVKGAEMVKHLQPIVKGAEMVKHLQPIVKSAEMNNVYM